MIMQQQNIWHIKMSAMFCAFLIGAIMFPFVGIGKIGFCVFEKFLHIPSPGCGIRSSIASLLYGNFNILSLENPITPFVLLVCIVYFFYFAIFAWTKWKLTWKKELTIFNLINKLIFYALMCFWLIRLIKL
jgi:hypothetical protein